jgi:hypothetical protein
MKLTSYISPLLSHGSRGGINCVKRTIFVAMRTALGNKSWVIITLREVPKKLLMRSFCLIHLGNSSIWVGPGFLGR